MNEIKNKSGIKINWNLFSKYKLELYGLIMIWIILFHSFEVKNVSRIKSFPLISGIINFGNCGVDFFLLLAGIFSYFSLKKDNVTLKGYYIKRFLRLMIPVVLIDWTYWAITDILDGESIWMFLSQISFVSFWNGHDTQVWYIAWILIMYLIAPFVKKIVDSKHGGIKIGLIILVYYALLFFMKYCGIDFITSYYKEVEIALSRGPIFLAGCFLGKKVYEKQNVNKFSLAVMLAITFFAISEFKFRMIPISKYVRSPFFVISLGVPLWIAIILDIIDIKQWKFIDNILNKVGSLSLEIYLAHVVLRKVFVLTDLYVNAPSKGLANLFNYIWFVGIGAFLISLIVSKISNYLYKKILNCRKVRCLNYGK